MRVYWQQKRKGKWKTIHGGLKPANKPFTFKQKLKGKGTWRVQVKYLNVAPYKASTAHVEDPARQALTAGRQLACRR